MACSINIRKQYCFSPVRGKPATLTAPFVSVGRSSSVTSLCAWRRTEADRLYTYLRLHPEVTDLLVTGGDPMVMKSRQLKAYLEPLLHPEFNHIQTIRIGTKALTFWPHRFISDKDADELIELIHHLVLAGKHVAIMAHYNHWRELDTDVARAAIRRVRATGAEIRSQGPLLAHVNDKPEGMGETME